jgi:SAM-dependent methyltransferase
MSTPLHSDPTTAYYDAHAERYVDETFGLDMADLYEPFLALVPPHGHILDAGCGSGRDALAFLRGGYRVTAIDASTEMAQRARELIGQPVEVRRFQDLSYEEEFNGIWACASLLHVPRLEMDGVFRRFVRALPPGGAWYMSFKLGEREEVRSGRLFTDYTETGLRQLIEGHPLLTLDRIWRTGDVRPEVSEQRWVNALVRKRTTGWPVSRSGRAPSGG